MIIYVYVIGVGGLDVQRVSICIIQHLYIVDDQNGGCLIVVFVLWLFVIVLFYFVAT